jgi:hypothetical protein
MRNTVVIVFMLFLLAGLATAQIPTAGNVFLGYSYQSAESSALNIVGGNRVNMNGWQATLEGKVFPVLGIVADFDGHYGSQGALAPSGAVNVTGHQLDVMFGPRVGFSVGKFRPFGEFEIGVGHMNTNALGSDTSFADALGGGIDYKLVRLVALRVEADYLSTRFFGTTQNNFRLSTGIAVHF